MGDLDQMQEALGYSPPDFPKQCGSIP